MDTSKASANGQDVRRTRRVALGPTRASWTWVTLIIAVVLGIALVDFLAQNTRSTEIAFFSVSGRVPLTVALLVASLAGASVVLVVGVARMIQLRRGVRATSAAEKGAVSEPLATPESRVGRAAAVVEPSDDVNYDV
jgi:uncharacterized integral membrane protein